MEKNAIKMKEYEDHLKALEKQMFSYAFQKWTASDRKGTGRNLANHGLHI